MITAALIAATLFVSGDASALGLKVAPLQYKTTLKENERSRGFIDVSNPAGQSVSVQTSIQAFRQINNEGGLQFYDDRQVQLGITPELTNFDLGPREAVRMYFTVNGANLPQGDVYAAIFFTTNLKQARSGVGQLVRVGTLLSIVNKSPGARSAEVTSVKLPLIQFSETVTGEYSIRNLDKGDTGFYPQVEISRIFSAKSVKHEGALVFGGRTRTNDFTYDTGYGVHWVKVGYGSSTKGQLVVTLAPWMLVLALFIAFIVGVELLLLRRRQKKFNKKVSSKPRPTSEK